MVRLIRITQWWRFFANSFDFRSNRDHSYFPVITHMLTPCHDEWWKLQPPYANDNYITYINPKGWEEVDGVKLPPVSPWAEE